MAAKPPSEPSSSSAPRAPMHSMRQAVRWLFPATQWAAVALTLLLGLRAYRLIDGPREQEQIDEAAAYFGAGLVLMLYFAWDGKTPAIRTWPRRLLAYARAHPYELAVLATICLIGAFVRLWRYGDLPPDGFIILEEHIHSGIAWDILRGARPYDYPSVRYGGALAQMIFGPSTLGVRGHLVIAGLLSVPVFYLVMRECVDTPYALFATAIFASLRVLGDTMPQYQGPMLEQLLMVWTALRALRTGVLLWFVPAAALGVILSYEYETSKAVPLFFGAFLVWIVVRRLAWPLPRSLGAEWERIRTHAPVAIKTAVIVAVIFVVGFGPIVGASQRGPNPYFASLDRQRADRDARGTPGLFAPNWQKQLEWSVQVFSPWMKRDFDGNNSIETRGAIDRITSLLLWVSVLAGAIFFWRGYRSLFVGWFLGGMIISSLLLSVWTPWKVINWVLPAVALTGFLAQDVAAVLRRYWQPALRMLPVALALIAMGALWFNLRTLNANAEDPRVLREYANAPSQLYAICDRLRGRPDDNYAFVSQRVRHGWAWSQLPFDDERAEAIAWGDFRFVCFGLRGGSVATLSELWPLNVQRDSPVSLVQIAEPAEIASIIDELKAIMPELGAPATRESAPADAWDLLIYDVTADQINARQGLVLEWLDRTGGIIDERIVHGPEFDLGDPPGDAATYRMRGLVYLSEDGQATLRALGDPSGTSIAVDEAADEPGAPNPQLATLRGWHIAEIRGAATPAITLALAWRQPPGDDDQIAGEDAFALRRTAQLYRHERTYAPMDGEEPFTAVRYDVRPHYAAFDGMRVGVDTPLPLAVRATSDRWNGVWNVPSTQTYRISLNARGQRMMLLIDGRSIRDVERAQDQASFDIELTEGDHTVQITFEPVDENVSQIGGVLSTQTLTGEEVIFGVRPDHS